MSWRFRQSFKILPGLKLNLSRSGLSASIGGAPFTLNLGSRGLYATGSIPGTGISIRQNLSGGLESGRQPSKGAQFPASSPGSLPVAEMGGMQEIRSASTELLTSDTLRDLKQLIQTAYEEHEQISAELRRASVEETRTSERFNSWNNGMVLKKLFKSSFGVRRAEAEISTAKRCELEEQLRLTTIATQVELAAPQAELYFKMRDDFSALAECSTIWDIKAQQATDQVRQRTTATRAVTRDRVRFSLGSCDLIQWEQEIPHLQNGHGGDLFLYPGFILYRASRTAFSVINYHDVNVSAKSVRFQEQGGVPTDSQVVGQTWAKTNKDGSRDRRFAENYEVPIALYGCLTLKSETGLWEEFQFSVPEKLERFAMSWRNFVAAFGNEASITVSNESSEDPAVAEPPQAVDKEVHFECSACGQPIEVNGSAAGQEFRCPGCGASLTVPQP